MSPEFKFTPVTEEELVERHLAQVKEAYIKNLEQQGLVKENAEKYATQAVEQIKKGIEDLPPIGPMKTRAGFRHEFKISS